MTDSLTATPERLAKAAGRIDEQRRDLRVRRDADRIVPAFERMARNNHLTPAQVSAGERFALHWHGARSVPGLTGAYGEQRWSGTSAGQSDKSNLSREEWPIYCAQEVASARRAITDPNIAAQFVRMVEADATLEDVGRAYVGCKSPVQAKGAGVVVAKTALTQLAMHYGFISTPRAHDD